MTEAAVLVPVDVVAREQPVNGLLEVRLGAATSLDQCDARSCVRNKDVTRSVDAVATDRRIRSVISMTRLFPVRS
jgi:hypothetical protein